MIHAKRVCSVIVVGHSLRRSLLLCAWDPVQCLQHPSPRPRPVWCTFENLFHTFAMQMPNGKPELCDSWSRLGKLGSGGYHYRASCGCTLSLGSRGENSGPRVRKNESNNHIPCGGSSKPLSMFNTLPLTTDHITLSFHTRFIRSSNSPTGWTRLNS
jgi:hypothetical protein